MKTKIIYEDNEIMVIYKPAGLAVQSSKVGEMDVVSELKNYLSQKSGKVSYIGIVHRLDQPVEGLLVFAKTKQAAANLTAQLQTGILNKKYYAVVCGKLEQTSGTLENYLYKAQNNTAKIVSKEDAKSVHAKKAVLHYEILNTRFLEGEQSFSLADIQIDTGRFHQIRVQMAFAGMPLAGDKKYGMEASQKISTKNSISYVALCAYELEFVHSAAKKKLSFQIKPEGKIFQQFFS